MIFRRNGFESEACYSAAEAFERAQSFAPSLMLCDISMPGESGWELAERVHLCFPDTRLLMLTAYSNHRVQMQAPTLHQSLTTLRKPCRPDDLLRATRALLQIA